MPDLFCFVGFLLYFLKSLSQPMSFLTSALPVLTPTVGGCVGLSCQLGNNHDSLLLKSTHGMDLQLSSTTAPETFQIHPKRFTNISRGKPDHWAASGRASLPITQLSHHSSSPKAIKEFSVCTPRLWAGVILVFVCSV